MSETPPFSVIIARRILTSVSGQELQRIAVSMIEGGHDCPDLHDLAWDPVISNHEAGSLFDAATLKMGLSMPSRTEAVEVLVYYHISRIAQGHCSPWEELAVMMRDVYWPELSNHSSPNDADMQRFIGAYWCYDELRGSPDVIDYNGLYGDEAVQAFDQHVRNAASEWLLRHPVPHYSLFIDEKLRSTAPR